MRTALLATTLLLAGCVTTDDGSMAEAERPSQSVATANQNFEDAFNAGDAAALADFYTEDAVVMPPGLARITGHPAIRELWQNFFDAGVTGMDLVSEELHFAGPYAFDVGSFTLSAPDGKGGRLAVNGKYIVIWRKERDGDWRLYRDIWNNDPAA